MLVTIINLIMAEKDGEYRGGLKASAIQKILKDPKKVKKLT